eukprot:TRINITY_DN845_c0_g1_i1.p1 TRINITY_DN845_c0_g1~~TRINITY_DN845_c0_g1_i1.p1  ORF type:complete len:490 (+),score=116.69 TRINITY_DN845_c0_g1_i1:51-1520(+)
MKPRVGVQSLVRSVQQHGHGCPCCSNSFGSPVILPNLSPNRVMDLSSEDFFQRRFIHSEKKENFDYGFEMATSTIRFGFGVTQEIGLDLKDWKTRKVCVLTDPTLASIPNSPVNTVLESLKNNGVNFELFTEVEVEPTDTSMKRAISFAQQGDFDAFVAVGGGSVMDTAKVANLFATHPADFLDYVNAPVGKGLPPPGPLKPLIAVPTTAGTGSETTGVAIFDLKSINAKTGFAHRRLKPTLGIVDPNNTRTAPTTVAAASGFDVLCHVLESYTAIPFDHRSPRPETPLLRPAYQGSNPISDVWSLKALELVSKWLPIAVEDPSNDEARSNVMLASSFAGVGFGNAGVHLCHGMSYPVSSLNRSYRAPDYQVKKNLIPHGMSVVLHAPAVFNFTASSNPQRHLTCAKIMGADITNAKDADAGKILVDQIKKLMQRLKVPNGLKAVGFTTKDIPDLVKGTLPQHRVTKLSPRPAGEPELAKLFEDSMELY